MTQATQIPAFETPWTNATTVQIVGATTFFYFARLFVQRLSGKKIQGYVRPERVEAFTESFWKFLYYTFM